MSTWICTDLKCINLLIVRIVNFVAKNPPIDFFYISVLSLITVLLSLFLGTLYSLDIPVTHVLLDASICRSICEGGWPIDWRLLTYYPYYTNLLDPPKLWNSKSLRICKINSSSGLIFVVVVDIKPVNMLGK